MKSPYRLLKRACGTFECEKCASLHASESECIILAKPMLHGGKAAASFGKADVFYRYPKPKNDRWGGLELKPKAFRGRSYDLI